MKTSLHYSQRVLELTAKIENFIAEHVIPLELTSGDHVPEDKLCQVQKLARSAALWAPHLPTELGGQGLSLVELLPVFEAVGESLFGPFCLGCAPPDESNGHLLLSSASKELQEKYLGSLARGEIRSVYAVSEPAPGAGADVRMMRTRAIKEGEDWIINGHKWFATGAEGARFAIVAAITNPEIPVTEGCTLFIIEEETPGYEVVRKIQAMGHAVPGGHCEIILESCRVPSCQILGAEGKGYQLIERRLESSTLTHCMRWLGIARRAQNIAIQRAKQRRSCSVHLSEHQAVQCLIADSAIDLHTSRLLVHDAAQKSNDGVLAGEISMCKIHVAEAVNRVIDRAIQVCGALGFTADLPLAKFYQEARAFRIYDGPSEIHRAMIARQLFEDS